MNRHILDNEVQEYITRHLHLDISGLALKGSPFEKVDTRELLEQIEAKSKAEKKLPTWYHTPGIYYPSTLSVEQTSSEIAARYKAMLFEGEHMTDITGGLGVDDYYFSKRFKKVVHCELNEHLSTIAAHNFKILGANNINCISGDGLEYLKQIDSTDLIYADPARRDQDKRKVFLLSDCTPDIAGHLDLLFSKSEKVVIKTSPLLDLRATIDHLRFVKEIHIVALKNEVKELLWILDRSVVTEDVTIIAVNLDKELPENTSFSFSMQQERSATSVPGDVSSYIFEPNAAIMKSGAFNLVGYRYNLRKLHPNTHLYTGDLQIAFPGRCFKVIRTEDFNKRTVKSLLAGKKANITTRNFPESVANLRKKFKIRDGGDLYAFFCTGQNDQKLMILAEKC